MITLHIKLASEPKVPKKPHRRPVTSWEIARRTAKRVQDERAFAALKRKQPAKKGKQ